MSKQKIALTTWFHHQNYGTALQAIALFEVIKSFGYDVDVVDYIPHNTRYTNEKHTFFSDSERFVDEARTNRFEQFVEKSFEFTKKCVDDEDFISLNKKYKAFVAGSDQIWSPIVFDSRYYLDYVSDNRKKISYGSSFGVPIVKNDMVRDRMANLMSQFAHLAAREDAGVRLIQEVAERDAIQVLDPTLLLSYDEWTKIIPPRKSKKKDKYILCYFLGDNQNQWKHVERISKQYKLPVKVIPTFTKDESYGELQHGVGPVELIKLIDSAELVLTDSFHGSLFAIIYSKPFYAFERFHKDDPVSQNSRLYNILKLLNIKDHLIGYEDQIRSKYDDKIDFIKIHKIIDENRQHSVAYLKDSLLVGRPKVSVIVPVYKVEEYIERCLDSVSTQTYENIEIIIIDDGTPDRSGDIADAYAVKDKRVKVIHKKNGGLSSARNAGLDVATGEYVIFVDSDDIIAPDFVEYMLGMAENYGVNIAASLNCYNEYSEEQNITSTTDRIELYAPEKAIEGIYSWFFPLPVWNKIYKRSFIEKYSLRFRTELLSAEGMTFNVMAFQNSGPIAVGRKQLYFQTFNPNSATRSTDIKRWETCFLAYKYQAKESSISNERIKRARDFHAWLCNSSIARQIYKAGEDKKYALNLFKYKWKLRINLLPVLRANISREQKIQYLHMAFFTKRDLTATNKYEEGLVKSKELLDYREMPWDEPKMPLPPIEVPSEPSETEILRAENYLLRGELQSMMSIKRSIRLVAGNIKRRLKYGRRRDG